MSLDITFCSGKGCVIKDHCQRYRKKMPKYATYFTKPPFKIKKKVFNCEMFWDNNNMILKTLKEIFGGKVL